MTITIKLRPFLTPNFVISENNNGTSTTWPLKDIGEKELSQLCDTFRAEIFKKAGKQDTRELKT
jgi:hypothetical protein